MIYLVLFLASIISGIGIGGGSIFIIINSIFNFIPYKSALLYSLIMFVTIGISNTIKNFNKKDIFNKKIFLKIIIFIIIGSYIGKLISNNIKEESLKLYFYIFMLIIGIYEIISSLKKYKKTKI